MRMYLIQEDLMSIVDGTETEPGPDPSQQTAAERYKKRKAKALAKIVLAVETNLLYLLGDPSDPREVWLKLQNQFQKNTWANKLRLKKRLYNMKLKPGQSLQEHLKVFIETFDELAVLGDAVPAEDRVINLLASLPDSYSTLVTALEAKDSVPTWEAVTQLLLHEEQKLSENNGNTSSQALSVVKKDFKSRNCHFCHKPGHIKKNCFKYKNSLKNKSEVDSGKANIVENNDVSVALFCSVFSSEISDDAAWVIDSGATAHMSNNKKLFTNLEKLDNPIDVKVGDGFELQAVGLGTVSIYVNVNGNSKKCTLSRVYYVPNLSYNLLSVSEITKKNKKVTFNDRGCEIFDDKNNLLAIGGKVGNLFILRCNIEQVNAVDTTDNVSVLWHRRLCHLGYDNVRKLINEKFVSDVNCKISSSKPICKCCCDGKINRSPFKHSDGRRNLKPFDLIHSDVCGNITPSSLGNGSYFVTFVDHATRYIWVYVIQNKSDVFGVFKDWKVFVEKQYGLKVKALRTDNGGEYTSIAFKNYLVKEGIKHEKTIPKTPQQNGVSERLNRTLVESIRSMLSDAELPKTFWAEALSTAVYVRNRVLNSFLVDKTPYEALNGSKPSIKHLRVFGCSAYVHVPKDERSKIDSKSKKCIFLGYSTVTKGYRFYDSSTKKIIFSRDVVFDELAKEVTCENNSRSVDSQSSQKLLVPISGELDSDTEPELPVESTLRRSKRERKEPDRLGEWVNISDLAEPLTVDDALSGPEAHLWRSAMQREIESLNKNNVWDLVVPKTNVKLINSKWIFKRKYNSDGEISSYKARLVAQGFSQRDGIDFHDTFSPVVRFESVRTILALAVQCNMEVHHMDVDSAFLNGELQEELFMKQPVGCEVPGKLNLVCKLKKSLYGLKQAPKCWNSALDSFLKEIGFEQSKADSCVYCKIDDGIPITLAVYVDDILLTSSCIDKISEVKHLLNSKYNMKDLGKLSYFLGVNVEQKDGNIFINQSAYVNMLLDKFGFSECKPVSTPADVGSFLSKAVDDSDLFDQETYQSAVGGLLYLCTRTRPDITHAVCNLSKYCSRPSNQHWCAVKRVFRYLKGTPNLGIFYSKQNNNNDFVGYSDADWAGDRDDRKSTSGYCFLLSNGLISWRSVKQSCVALSTAEAEYVSLSSAAQEAIWIGNLLCDVEVASTKPIVLFEDNQSAICLAKNPKSHSKTKHIEIKYHFVRDLISSNKIELNFCPTDKMLADIFTKSLPKEKFMKLRDLLGMK